MSARTKKMTLKFLGTATLDGLPAWEVVQVSNAYDFNPGEVIGKDRFKDLINLGLFEVTIIKGKK